jgi:hypothetical protein
VLRKTLSLLLPALIPSWRFFKTVAPSPRVEYRLKGTEDWRESHPLPERLRGVDYLRRLLFSPDRNTPLYMVSLSERLVETESAHAKAELHRLIRATLPDEAGALEFRLLFVSREGGELVTYVEYESGWLS